MNCGQRRKHCTFETFIEAIKNELQKREQIKKRLPKSKLTKTKVEAPMKDLRDLRDNIITVTKAGKGSAVVIRDVEDYIIEANPQLNNTDSYRDISNDPNENKRKKVNNAIFKLKSTRLLDKNVNHKANNS